ncbi:hypothetical protein MPDQ_005285 [Monascus purpureus]|uniref:Uncharacterized protein n=1 Tax=Monascus purpureus TaxID=5098 RepID=A0A507QWI9_MONPU|nr:hypothetical protein MPDQ_005285 [Monascus purpureus]BDD58032.1 hypothetical protein MAP00_003344 [Monascus purpureus]
MILCSFRLPLERWLPARCVVLQSRRLVSANASDSYSKPLPSDVVRFLLEETTQRDEDRRLCPEVREHLQGLLLAEPSRRIDLQLMEALRPNTAPNPELLLKNLDCIRDLGDFRRLVERNVNGTCGAAILQTNHCELLTQMLTRCERFHSYRDILSTLNGLVARLGRLGAYISPGLHYLGMHYACLCFSASALKYHLQGYRNAKGQRLSYEASISLVKALLSTLQSIKFENSNYDPSPMFNVLMGERASVRGAPPRLHDSLIWSDNSTTTSIEVYLLLLVKMGNTNRESLEEVWRRFLERVASQPSTVAFQSAYTCILAMTGRFEARSTVLWLKKVSKLAGNILPGISKFRDLNSLVAAPELHDALPFLAGQEERKRIFVNQLEHMEKRLGLQWQALKSSHSSISDTFDIATNQPLLAIDGENFGFDSRERLLTEIRYLGCSKSATDLGTIADLLNEHEGSEIPVAIPGEANECTDFSWIPHLSPIEFAGSQLPKRHNTSEPWSPSTLGLIRARPLLNGAPRTGERTLHLMQLGYLVTRPKKALWQIDKNRSWQETGHIVAWDRIRGEFVGLFLGKGRGLVDVGLRPESFHPPAGLGIIEKIRLLEEPEITPSTINGLDIVSPAANVERHYFDVDPAELVS